MSFISRKKISTFDMVNYLILFIICAVCIIPFLYVLSISLTADSAYEPFKFYLIPEKFSFAAYSYILSTVTFMNALKSTVFITVVGTFFNLLVTFTLAYALTKKEVPGRNIVLGLVIFTLVFSAGMIPTYLLVSKLGLINSYWALILSALTSAWSLIVVKSFMDSLPIELEEAAKIDGCNDLMVFIRIVVPISKASIAAFTLFFAVAHWNTYFDALIYLTDDTKRTLQVLIKSLVVDSNAGSAGSQMTSVDEIVLPSEILRLASVVFGMVPILVIYPFLQKYFVKGVMLGSIKG
jgi:putative aldouronate transport system permease protein